MTLRDVTLLPLIEGSSRGARDPAKQQQQEFRGAKEYRIINTEVDYIIIGSGLGGLECAHMLSKAGHSVLLLEREVQSGGCMQSYKRRGMEFDTGLHYVGGLEEGQALYEPFKQLGLLRLPWVKMDSDCFDKIHISGDSYNLAQGYDNFVNSLAKVFPDERESLEKYVKTLHDCHDAEAFKRMFAVSAYDYLHEIFHNELLINIISGNSVRMELQKETLPLFIFAHVNSSYVESSWRLKGSGNLIVDSLIRDIKTFGGEIVCNAEVEELIEKDGKIVAAKCSNGETYEADNFISDIHPALTYDLIKDSKVIRKSLRRRMQMIENTYGIMTTSLVIKPNAIRYVNHNDYIYKEARLWDGYENDPTVSGVMVSYRVPEDGSPYVRQIDLLTPIAWSECEKWINTKVGRRGEDYAAWKLQKADECIALAETVVPHLKDNIERMYTSSPLTYRDYTLTPQGSAYGMRKDWTSPLLTVLSPKTPLPNLYLSGQSLMLHGVEGVTMTAIETVRTITHNSIE